LQPPVIAVVLKVHMHCEACAQAIKKRILKMKGEELMAAIKSLKSSFPSMSILINSLSHLLPEISLA
jgi:copper chaperone CopZ